MWAEPKTGVRSGIGFGVPGELDIGFYVPQSAKVAVTNGADTASELIEKTRLSRRLLQLIPTVV